MAVPRPREGVCGGAKFFGSALLQPACSVSFSSECFFHSICRTRRFGDRIYSSLSAVGRQDNHLKHLLMFCHILSHHNAAVTTSIYDCDSITKRLPCDPVRRSEVARRSNPQSRRHCMITFRGIDLLASRRSPNSALPLHTRRNDAPPRGSLGGFPRRSLTRKVPGYLGEGRQASRQPTDASIPGSCECPVAG